MKDRRPQLHPGLVALLAALLTAPPAVAGGRAPRLGDRPPQIDVTVLEPADGGNALDWEEDLADQVVILDFWATWCPPCAASIPHLNRLVDRFRDDPVRFISISYETEDSVREFLDEHPMETVVALDNDFATFKGFGAWGVPTVVLVSRKGIIAGVIHPGDLSEEVISDLLAGTIPAVPQAESYPDPEGAEKLFRTLRERSETCY
jgi:thiol-disulfide isomerase/thioredoxin